MKIKITKEYYYFKNNKNLNKKSNKIKKVKNQKFKFKINKKYFQSNFYELI